MIKQPPPAAKFLPIFKRACIAVSMGVILAAPVALPAFAALADCDATTNSNSLADSSASSDSSSVSQPSSSIEAGNNSPCTVTARTNALSSGGDSGDTGTGGGGGASGAASGGSGDGGDGGGRPAAKTAGSGSGGDGGGNGGNGGGGGFAGGGGFMSGATSDNAAPAPSSGLRNSRGVTGGGIGAASGQSEGSPAGVPDYPTLTLTALPFKALPASAGFCLDSLCVADSIKRVSASTPSTDQNSPGNSSLNSRVWATALGLMVMLKLFVKFNSGRPGKLVHQIEGETNPLHRILKKGKLDE